MIKSLVDGLERVLPQQKLNIFGKESLITSTLPYYCLLSFMISGSYIAINLGSPYIVVFMIYGLIPLVDEIISHDWRNPLDHEVKDLLRRNWQYEAALYITVIVDWCLFFYAMHFLSTRVWSWSTIPANLTFLLIYSNLSAAQFSVSHQILHKAGWRRIIGTLHMLKTLNMHFTYEHLFGHHRKVATPEDPASANKGENVYSFFVKSYFGAYRSVYNMQKDQRNKYFYQNMAVLSVLSSIAFASCIFYLYGPIVGCLFLLEVLGAVFYLEVINFIEHYGLRRKKKANGEYENVTPIHSWNAPHRYSNYIFFKLQRHSDHHYNSLKPYQTLLSIEESPQLPHGYSVMTMLALFPSMFRDVMDPLVDSYNYHDNKLKVVYKQSVLKMRKFVIEIVLATLTVSLLAKVFDF